MKIAQILHNRVHWIFESDEIPSYPPAPNGEPLLFVDISDKSDVVEGWNYQEETGDFYPPLEEEIPPEITLEDKINFIYYKQMGVL